jgi:hypothetical protein
VIELNRRVPLIICSLSLIGNCVLGVLVFGQGQITKKDVRYGSYSLVYPRLKLALEYAANAAEGKEISTNLALANEQLYLVDGILRGLNGDASSRGINFEPLVDALDARLGLPEVHEGDYTPQEMNSIKIAKDRLQRLVKDLQGTEYSTVGMGYLRHTIENVDSYATAWGY